MFLFLQNWRYTIIPTIVVPIALLGTFATLLALGFSINVLTDVRHGAGDRHRGGRCDRGGRERRAHHERGRTVAAGRHPQGDAADLGRHHRRDRGADLGVRAAGLLRGLDRQHLPPVLGGDGGLDRASRPSWRCRSRRRCAPRCSSRWKPATTTRSAASSAGSTAASRARAKGYPGVRRAHPAPRRRATSSIYAAIIGAVVSTSTATAELASCRREDQGNIIVNVQLPPGATQERALSVMQQVEGFIMKQRRRSQSMVSVMGFSFSGQGQNARPRLRDAQGLGRAQGPGPTRRARSPRPALRRALRASATPSSTR